MKTTYVSTLAVANATRRSVILMQTELTQLQKEVTTGRKADVGLALGERTGRTVALRSESENLQTLIDTNAVARLRLQTTQHMLDGISGDAQAFLGILVDAKSNPASASITRERAEEKLSSFIGKLNSTLSGEFLFAGINTNEQPLGDYSDPASPARQAVANAFMTRFGIAQTDPAVSNIPAVDIQNFLDNEFAALFNDPAWSTNWSTASNQATEIRISTSETVTTGAVAGDAAMRKIAMVYTMVSDLGLPQLSSSAYTTLVDKAIGLLGSAIAGITTTQAGLGYSEQAVADASGRLSIQKDMIDVHIGELEGVDPYKASTRISELLTQIETAYALTGRIQQLSLLDYLR
jgi:flagellar hook-associated protein 3 FlgL